MKQIAQNYKSGDLVLLDVPVPACRPGGVLVRTQFSLISTGTEMMKITESKLSLIGKARARPDQVKKVMQSVSQQGLLTTYRKVTDRSTPTPREAGPMPIPLASLLATTKATFAARRVCTATAWNRSRQRRSPASLSYR
jgi:hypothetical protein